MTGIELTLCLLLTTSPYPVTGNPALGEASVPTSQPVRVAELYGTGQSFRNVPVLKQRVTAPFTDQQTINSAGYGNFNGGWQPTVMAAPHVVLPGVMYEQSYTVPYAHVEQIQTPQATQSLIRSHWRPAAPCPTQPHAHSSQCSCSDCRYTPEIHPDDYLNCDPGKCQHEYCETVEEPVVRWQQVDVVLEGWEHIVEETKRPFCKTDCPTPNRAECIESYGMVIKKTLVEKPKQLRAVRMEPFVDRYSVEKCVRCGMIVSGGPFSPGYQASGGSENTKVLAEDLPPTSPSVLQAPEPPSELTSTSQETESQLPSPSEGS